MIIKALKYGLPHNYDAQSIPTLECSIDIMEGQMLDFNDLSGEDFIELIGKAPVITYPGNLDTYVMGMMTTRFCNINLKYLPNIIFVPEGFDSSIIDSTFKPTIITRKELKGNQFLFAHVDELSFPAYKDESGKIDIINPCFIMAVITAEEDGNNGNSNDL